MADATTAERTPRLRRSGRLARPERPRPDRSRLRYLAIAVVGVLALAGTTACESTKEDREAVVRLVNQSRAAAGRAPLGENLALHLKADGWARHLRDICNLKHSKLSDGAPPDWRKLGENVGMGGSINQVHTAYLNSSGHKRNILDPSFTQMGAAAVWGRCGGHQRVFTVHVFMAT